MRVPPAWTGLLLLAAMLAAVEWFASGRVSTLGLRMLAAGAAGYWIFRIVPWARLLALPSPGSRAFRFALFLVFLSHFTRVLGEEARRLYIARGMVVKREFGPGGFSSLVSATASLFARTFARAERFYAALLVRGIG